MKKILLYLIAIVYVFLIPETGKTQSFSFSNFLITYCDVLGLETYIDESCVLSRNLKAILPNGEHVSAYDFLYGNKGSEYSYCNKMGYEIEKIVYKRGNLQELMFTASETKMGQMALKRKKLGLQIYLLMIRISITKAEV